MGMKYLRKRTMIQLGLLISANLNIMGCGTTVSVSEDTAAIALSGSLSASG